MTYPKLPNGPSPQGAAAVRGLGDVTFQRKVGADYVATVKDGFSRVEVMGGDTYLVSGMYSDTNLKGINFATKSYRTNASKSALFDAQYQPEFREGTAVPSVSDGAKFIPVRTDVLVEDPYFSGLHTQFFHRQTMTFGSGKVATFDYWWSYNLLPHVTSVPWLLPDSTVMSYTGQVTKSGAKVGQYVGFTHTFIGVSGAYGNKYMTPSIQYAFSDGTTALTVLSVPGGFHFFVGLAPVIFCGKFAYVVAAEAWTSEGLEFHMDDVGGPGAVPPVWLFASADGGATWSSGLNISSAFPDIPTTYEPGYYALHVANWFDGMQRYVALDDETALMFTTLLHTSSSPVPLAVKITAGSVAHITLPVSDGWVYDVVHVGSGKVFAIVVHYEFVNYRVDFWRSADGGITWESVVPTGFTSAFDAKFFGNHSLTTEVAATATKDGVFTLVAWDETGSAYYFWASNDMGSTWARCGRVTPAIAPGTFDDEYFYPSFSRYSHVNVLRGATSARKIDQALPTRYASKG